MRQVISEADAKEAGIKKELYQDWIDVMQALWEASIVNYKAIGDDALPKQGENEILIGGRFKIVAHMVNNSYVEVRLSEGEMRFIDIRHMGNVMPVCKCVFIVINDLIKRTVPKG